jgi:biotin carboxylase
MKKIMILGAGPLQIPAIAKAKELGNYVIALDYDTNAPGFRFADISLEVSTLDKDGVLAAAKEYCPDVVMTSTSDAPVVTVAYVNEQLGRTGEISHYDAIAATNKAKMRERFQSAGMRTPKFHIVSNFDEYLEAISCMEDCFIVKPADSAGSRGVQLIQPETTNNIEVYERSKGFSRQGVVLVEEYLSGPEVSVEAFTVNGEAQIITVTDKLTTEPPYFVELGHSQPSRFSASMLNDICEETQRALHAINIINGPSHTELKITNRGPIVIETAARLGGDYITSRLVPLSCGVDMVACQIKQLTGEAVDLVRKVNRGSSIRFLTAKAGIISSIKGVDQARAVEGVKDVVLTVVEGSKVKPLESSTDRIGYVIADGATAEEAIKACEMAMDRITIQVEDDRLSCNGASAQ